MPCDKIKLGLDLVLKEWDVACLQGWGSSQEQQPPQVLGDDLKSFTHVLILLINPLSNLGSISSLENYENSSIV